MNTGLEYFLLGHGAVRIGYRIHHDIAGLTVGFGARLPNLSIDYAWGMNDSLGDEHRISVTVRFGTVPVREREKARRPYIESVPEREQLKEIEREKPATMDRPPTPRHTAPESPKGAPGWIY